MDRYRVEPRTRVDLDEIDPRETSGFDGDKAAAEARLSELRAEISDLQQVFYAQGEHRLLVVFQATDTGGKDGTTQKVFDDVSPAGIRVANFKKPTEHELARDFLWRVHHHVPRDGEIVVFNRSHYEDVLIVRVHGLVPEERWSRRYDHIRDFEQMLVDEGTTILKFFLHISKDEQRERLQARLDEPNKRWKFDPSDLDERVHWDDYQRAYAEAIERTSTEQAPWHVVPADRKWYRNVVVAQIVRDTLSSLDLRYPERNHLDEVTIT